MDLSTQPSLDAMLQILQTDGETDLLDINYLQGIIHDLEPAEWLAEGAVPAGDQVGTSSGSAAEHHANNYSSGNNNILSSSVPAPITSGSDGHIGDTSDQLLHNHHGASSAQANGPAKKKRTRNSDQMAQNRVAQQKYRERKKAEHADLQEAVDVLTAQLAAMKALEVRANELEVQNVHLTATNQAQAERLVVLEGRVSELEARLHATARHATEAAAMMAQQQRMILDQHAKLALQEEVINALRTRLSKSAEAALADHEQKHVCETMKQAVRAALAGAKGVDGLQMALAELPDELVVSITRHIYAAVREMWPQLAQRVHGQAGPSCGQCVKQVC